MTDVVDSYYEKIDALTGKQLDALPFGTIQLDHAGTVLKYNAYEAQIAGLDPAKVVGRNFFTEVAPCTNVKEFYGRFQTGAKAKTLNEKFRYQFNFTPPLNVLITLFYSRSSD